MKRQSVIVFCLLFFLHVPVSAASPAVSYDGIAGELVFCPGSAQNPQQLFYGFSDLRPGDLMADRIVLSSSGQQEVNVYFRLDMSPSEDLLPFLSQFVLDIQDRDGRKVFSGTLEKALQWVYLGTVCSGQAQFLEMTLSAPLQTAPIQEDFSWRFLGTEVPGDHSLYSGTDFLPPTGDPAATAPAAILLISAPVLLLLLKKLRT